MQPTSPKWLDDIRRACDYIQEDVAGFSLDTYLRDRRARQLVERNLSIIGEAIARIERSDAETAEHISHRRQIKGLRNRLAHGYDDEVDHEIIWEAVHASIPALRAEVVRLIPDKEDEK